jgi:hypothetical protein
MANNYSINIRCSEHFRSLIRDSWLAQKEKEEKTGRDYPESVHIRMLLLAAMKKRGSVAPKPAVDESFAVIKEQIAKAWDEEMPPELPRISVKSSKRDQSLKARWSENSNIEDWRHAFRALAQDKFHMQRKAPMDYILRPSHFAKWIEAGIALRDSASRASAHISILEEIENGF